MLSRSARGVSCGSTKSPDCPNSFSTATDSPVSPDSSICKSRTLTKRKSAGTLSPEVRVTKSPTTSSFEGTLNFLPPRMTVASVVTALARASIFFSAPASWTKLIMALVVVTPQITMALSHSPISALIKPALSKIISNGWLNCMMNFNQAGFPAFTVSSLGPNCCWRLATSVGSKPLSRLVSNVVATFDLSK